MAESPIAFDPEKFWLVPNEDAATTEAVSREALLVWETQHGLHLPESLKAVLQIKNGGYAFTPSTKIYPVSEIRNLTDPEWENVHAHHKNDDYIASDRAKLITIGFDAEMCAEIILNYHNISQPTVYWLHRDMSDELCVAASSLDEFWLELNGRAESERKGELLEEVGRLLSRVDTEEDVDEILNPLTSTVQKYVTLRKPATPIGIEPDWFGACREELNEELNDEIIEAISFLRKDCPKAAALLKPILSVVPEWDPDRF